MQIYLYTPICIYVHMLFNILMVYILRYINIWTKCQKS